MATTATITMTLSELEALVRRVVQETLREELTRALRSPDRAVLEFWEHEGPEDPEGDAELLADAEAVIAQYERNPSGWVTLEEFEADLAGESGGPSS
jgi:hypothetical protein